MSNWKGFTDEILNNISESSGKNNNVDEDKKNVRTASFTKTNKKSSLYKLQSKNTNANKHQEDINDSQKLSRPAVIQTNISENLDSSISQNLQKNKMTNEIKNNCDDRNVSVKTSEIGVQECLKPDTDTSINPSDNELEINDIDDALCEKKENESIEKYRQRQKEIEEMNKKKRAILTSAISEKMKKTNEEALKLSIIGQELEALDQMVAADVSIVRDHIEAATRNYSLSQRRYEQAEREFIAAKIELHEKSELKKQLTEHLYTIIHQNELRKAQKLDQLTSQLDSNIAKDDVKDTEFKNESTVIPSTLTSTITQPDVQKFRQKLQTSFEKAKENTHEELNLHVENKDVN